VPQSPSTSSSICAAAVAERLARFASRAQQAIFVGGADGRVEWANESACRLCGFECEEIVGRRLQLFPDDPVAQDAAAKHVETRLAAGEVARLEASLVARDGRVIWIELQVTPVPAADGSAGWVAIASDVSERKRADAALAESEERYRRLVEDSPEPAAVHCGGVVVYVNRAALALLGASSPEAVLGRPVFEFLHPDYHGLAAERILKMETLGDPAGPVVEKLLRLDGSPVDVELAATPVLWRGKPAIQLAGHALCRTFEGMEEPRRAPVMDFSSLVLELAPRIESRIAPRAALTFDLGETPVALPGSSAPLAELICSLAAQASAALPRGRGALRLSTRTRELGAEELAAFAPRAGARPGRYLVFEACANAGALAPEARRRLFDADFARSFPGAGPGLRDALASARTQGGGLRVERGARSGLRIALALPAASSPQGGSSGLGKRRQRR